ncbi:hypothetical protein Ping_0993 [Psychromonas ingrahamii 37]|uniref:DUF1439 domain-containing protein n=1 Tax=Psychromonas ingrahamii (strain DSM 17664 / CCUG 51855 / 37) TaxID=357804 RepID=A1STL7_PSYIN|nr:DUF1439 domain-containing protein [Psychromonas ingrahamii]ABM02832.1 hypothetical protein Ping_0993 [Psychromonas ingrahamii 37]
MLHRIFFICLLTLSSLSTLPSFATALPYTLKITEQELQEKLTKELPIKKEAAYISAKIYDSRVDLIEGSDQIGVFTRIDITVLGNIKGSGWAYAKGVITYNAEKKAFYLINPNIISLEIENIPPDLMPEIKKIAQLSLEKAVQFSPFYLFNDQKTQEKMANSSLQSILVKNQTLLIKMSLL